MDFLQNVIDHIEQNLHDELSLEVLAVIAGYSPWHFARIFSMQVGIAPGRYIRKRRLSEAALMIKSGKSLYDTAAALGFSSAPVLSRAFIEEFGCTPGAFRKGQYGLELQNYIRFVKPDIDWRKFNMDNIKWIDHNKDDKGYSHSYPAALFSALKAQGETVDFEDIMGCSGFAFRIDMHFELCPSASSVFDWHELDFAVKNSGYRAQRIMRLWDEYDLREDKRGRATIAIKTALKQGRYAVSWDMLIPEWCMIAGYDESEDAFICIGPSGLHGALPASRLGQREIEIMDVTIMEGTSNESMDSRFKNALIWAVEHARGKHWTDRPSYEQGLAAWNMWADYMDKMDQTGQEPDWHVEYFASMAYTARKNAARFIRKYSGNDLLIKAADEYDLCAEDAGDILQYFKSGSNIEAGCCKMIAESVRNAAHHDGNAVEYIEQWLG